MMSVTYLDISLNVIIISRTRVILDETIDAVLRVE